MCTPTRKTQSLDPRDRELLQRHAELCKKCGWGNGFEQTFLVDESIGIAAGLLSPEEADTERDILLYFAPKLQTERSVVGYRV